MVKAKEVVKEVRRIRLFGVNIAKEVTRITLFGKEIFSEVDITDQLHYLSVDVVAPKLSAVPIPVSPLKLTVSSFSGSNNSSLDFEAAVPPPPLPVKNDGTVRKIKIKFVARQKSQLPLQVRRTVANLGGTDLVFLTNKKVEVADVGQRWGRLFIPKEGVDGILKALTPAEKQILKISGEKIEKKKNNSNINNVGGRVEGKIEVTVVDGKGNMYDMDFKKWPSLGKLVLAKQWYKFAKDCELEAGNSIQLWCFRDASSRLCFAIVKNE